MVGDRRKARLPTALQEPALDQRRQGGELVGPSEAVLVGLQHGCSPAANIEGWQLGGVPAGMVHGVQHTRY